MRVFKAAAVVPLARTKSEQRTARAALWQATGLRGGVLGVIPSPERDARGPAGVPFR